jgi:hypothetical protein
MATFGTICPENGKAYDVASLNGVGSILILTNEMSLYDLIMWQVNPLKREN